jgi:hypothetical protein
MRWAWVVDDSPERYEVLELFLRSRWGVEAVRFSPEVPEDFGEAWVVSLDYHLAGSTALEALKRLPPERLAGRLYVVHSTAGLEATLLEDWLRKQGLEVIRYPYTLIRMEVRPKRRLGRSGPVQPPA